MRSGSCSFNPILAVIGSSSADVRVGQNPNVYMQQDNHVVLIGMMGVGKTSVGRLVAKHLGWYFWDNDVALSEATGKTAAEVQRVDGQAELHRLELRLLRTALERRDPTVFAAGGSVAVDPTVVSGQLTVWLRASADREMQNLAHSRQHHRPLQDDPAAVVRRLAAQRAPLYAQMADITVDIASDPSSTCELVCDALRNQTDLHPRSRRR